MRRLRLQRNRLRYLYREIKVPPQEEGTELLKLKEQKFRISVPFSDFIKQELVFVFDLCLNIYQWRISEMIHINK